MSETSSITKPILDALEQLGIFALRLNSGVAKKGRYYIKLCPAGTADIVAYPSGKVLWIETKEERDLKRKGDTATAQEEFRQRVERLGHKYIRATKLEDVLNALK